MLIFNGEIYNAPALRAELMTREVRDQLKDQVALNPFEFETLKKNMAFVDLDRTETVKEQPEPAKKESEETKPAGA